LGWIPPNQRTAAQASAHATAMGVTVAHALLAPTFAPGQFVKLYDFWKAKEVVDEAGLTFNRVHQLTGSCVWAGGTNAVFSSIAAQRMASDNPIQAFLPFTLGNYAMSRHYMGDDGRGEGSLGSTFARSLTKDGLTKWDPTVTGIPQFNQKDGVAVASSSVELNWSSYNNPLLPPVLTASAPHTFGSATPATSAQDVKALIANGYGVTFACNNYIGGAKVEGSGADACLIGYWDSYGPHQQSIHAYWEHPQFGPLYWAQNNWPGNTYPADPAGGPVCGCWVREAKVDWAMKNLDSEVFGLSSLNWFPAQPKVFTWAMI